MRYLDICLHRGTIRLGRSYNHPLRRRDVLTADQIRKELEDAVRVCTMGNLRLIALDDRHMLEFAADIGWYSNRPHENPGCDALYSEINAREWTD